MEKVSLYSTDSFFREGFGFSYCIPDGNYRGCPRASCNQNPILYINRSKIEVYRGEIGDCLNSIDFIRPNRDTLFR